MSVHQEQECMLLTSDLEVFHRFVFYQIFLH